MKKLIVFLLISSLFLLPTEAQVRKTTKKPTQKTSRKQSTTSIPPKTHTITTKSVVLPTPTPTPTITLPKFEAEILAELNLLRANPKEYAKHLEDFLNTFDGKYFKNSDGIALISIEGKVPVEEVIATLKQTNPLPQFKTSDGLLKAAFDHAQDLVKNNITGHKGSDGSLPAERVSRYGIAPLGVNENISYGTTRARDVVFTMLIDDGTASRNHRKNLLNPQLKIVGLATGENKIAGIFCVLVLATSYSSKTP